MAKLKMIDRIGSMEAEIARLQKKVDKLRDRVKDYRGVGEYEGDEYVGSVYEQDSTHPNTKKLKKHFGADWHKYLVKKTMTCLKVRRKPKRGKRKE